LCKVACFTFLEVLVIKMRIIFTFPNLGSSHQDDKERATNVTHTPLIRMSLAFIAELLHAEVEQAEPHALENLVTH